MIKIGELITDEQERDAIHIAVAPVIANETLKPGEDIGFSYDDKKTVSKIAFKKIGIVDPFLTNYVQPGDKFWMFLYPNTITSLRHDWTHPEFERELSDLVKSKQWITNWAAQYNMTYEDAIRSGEEEEFFLGEVCYDHIPEEFWDHFKVITGKEVSKETRQESHFRCAC